MLTNVGTPDQDQFQTIFGFKIKVAIVLTSWVAIAICGFTGYAMQGQTTVDEPDSNTLYTFELTMNGHNAPLQDQQYNNYAVPLGHITP